MSRASSIGIWVLKVALTALLLWYIVHTVPLGEVMPTLKTAHMPDVLAAMAALLAARVLMGLRMKQVTDRQGLSLSVPQLIGISLTSTFYGMFLPGSLSGGLVRWYRLSRQDGKPTEALAAIGFDRLMDTLMGAGFGLGCWLISAQARHRPVIGLGLLAAFLGCGTLYFIAFHAQGARLTSNAIGRLIEPVIPRVIRNKLKSVLDATGQYHDLPPLMFLSTVVLSLLIHFAATVAFVFLGRALDIRLSLVEFGWIRSAWLLLAMLPVTVAGLGMREGSMLLFLRPYGVAAAAVIALSCLRLAASLAIAALGGLLELRYLRLAGRNK